MSSPNPSWDAMAAAAIDETDVRLLERVAAVYDAIDPVPAGLIDRIRFGVTLDALEAEIAELQRTVDLAGVRSDSDQAQTVTFTSANLTTMVTITVLSADRVRIDGWVAPGGGVSVELQLVEDKRDTVADADGRFVFDDVPRGLARFVLRHPAPQPKPPVITPSIEL